MPAKPQMCRLRIRIKEKSGDLLDPVTYRFLERLPAQCISCGAETPFSVTHMDSGFSITLPWCLECTSVKLQSDRNQGWGCALCFLGIVGFSSPWWVEALWWVVLIDIMSVGLIGGALYCFNRGSSGTSAGEIDHIDNSTITIEVCPEFRDAFEALQE
jgi:hypothetical protein